MTAEIENARIGDLMATARTADGWPMRDSYPLFTP